MMAGALSTLRWCLSLGAKFGRVVFWQTSLIVLLTLVSQISTLLASLLPLKVVILLGSEGVPRYVPEALATQGRDLLIVILSVATVGFFMLHLLVERLINSVTAHATQRLLAKSHKMVLFENQNEIAANAYQRFSRALAGVVFGVLALIGLYLLYPDMAWTMLGYIAVAVVVLWALGTLSASFCERLENQLAKFVTLIAGIGFFVSFAYLVVDFIILVPPAVLVAIMSLLLSRQLLARLAGIMQDIVALNNQRMRIDVLFFHGKVLLPPRVKEDKTIWPFLEVAAREEWVAAVLRKVVVDWKGHERIEWHPSGNPNVAALKVAGKSATGNYLVKLFEANRKSLALHESMLLSDPPYGLPAPMFLGSTNIGSFTCLVYRIPDGTTMRNPRELRSLVHKLRGRLLAVEPPKALTQRYQRSRPVLWQRIESDLLKRLYVAVDSDEQKDEIALLLTQLPVLRQQLKSLPLVLVNPEIGPISVWADAQTEEPILLNWGRWELEPVGAGWTVATGLKKNSDEVALLGAELEAASAERPCLADVRVEVAELAALVSALEIKCQKQQLIDGLELVGRILERLEVLRESETVMDVQLS